MNPVIKVSDNAALRIKEIMSSAEKDSLGVRVSVKTGGCAGMSYVMEYTCLLYTSPSPRDATLSRMPSSA